MSNRLIGAKVRTLRHMLVENEAEGFGSHLLNLERTDDTAAPHQRHDSTLVFTAAILLRALLGLEKGLINLDCADASAEWGAVAAVHALTNTVRHEPHRLVCHTEHPMKLV